MGEERGSAIWGFVEQRGGGDVRTSLASADGGGESGGGGDLKSTKNAWTRAGSDVGGMQRNIKKALTEMEKDQTGLGSGSRTGSLQSAAAQRDVYGSWKRYLSDVSARCGTLQDRLSKAGNDHYANETATKGAFDQLKGEYEDTAGVGGQGRQNPGG